MANRKATYISVKDENVAHFFRWYAQRAEGMNASALRVWWRKESPNIVSIYFEHNYPVYPNYVEPASVSSSPRENAEGQGGKYGARG